MQADRWKQVEELFESALAQPPEKRAPFLEQACPDDPQLRSEVQSLLNLAPAAASFLEGSPLSSHQQRAPALARGQKLGSFEILEVIGRGGMGEVYRARDKKLGRNVAIKVLPEWFAHDAERLARFEREAQVLASLNHSHIATIYGLEDTNDVRALVMELVEGPTLAEQIGGRAIPLNEVLPIAKQIAEGLEYAHERGIIHRDLKPSNVKLTADGNVKILDFGLAKALDTPTPQGDPSISPTLTQEGTLAGVILGTAAYMSPEQARGAVVDKRADIWSFGVVLYEMLTGKQPFAASTVSDTVAAVLKTDPKWDLVPTEMRRLVRRCLVKDQRLRLRDIGEARIVIEQPATELGTPTPVRSRAWLPWAVAIALGTVAVTVSLRHFQEKVFEAPPVRLTVTPPGVTRQFWQAISPDGRRLAFIIHDASGVPRIWMRALDRLAAQPLAGTEGAGYGFFWSPDSRFLAFQVGTQLKKIDAAGGTPQVLGTVRLPFITGTWGRDGTILVGQSSLPIYRLSASGGETKPVTELDASTQETGHTMPWLLPDGRHFLYVAVGRGTPAIWVTSLDDPKVRRRLLDSDNPDGIQLAYSQGHLLFGRNSNLMAQAFDPDRLKLQDEPVTLAENTLTGSVSGNGVLAYRSRAETVSLSRLTWFDREGKQLGVVGPAGRYGVVALSPDQSRIAADKDDLGTDQDVFVIESARGTSMRLTSHPAHDWWPVWSPDGTRIVFHSDRDGQYDLYQRPSNGTGQDEILLRNANDKVCLDWSSDGRYLLYMEYDDHRKGALWLLPMTGERKPIPYLRTEFNEVLGKFSPDGHWIAYISDESGRNQVYVQSLPPGSGKWPISAEGGEYPAWRRDGKELYYSTQDGDLMAVEVKIGVGFQAGVPKRLFKAPVTGKSFGVSADGGRFLMAVPVESDTIGLINVVVNWTSELKR